DVEGYNNYQGVPVIGAWTWLPEHHFGLATEIHLDEAFKPLFTLRTAFLYLFVLLIISLLISFVLRTRQWSIERERTLAQKARRESDERTRSIIANATDGIITIDSKGIVESFNPAAESLFQYRAEEVIGKNVNMLMPEPYHSQHDSYLENYLRTGMATVIGAEREVLGKRKDGTTFPMELSVSEMNLEERRLFIGIARDITERKKAEEKLRASKEQMRKLYSHLQSVREEERTRIAREVHDELGQELTALKMDLSWLNKKIPLHNKPLVEKILMMNQTLETTIETVQRISGDLRPAILDVLGLAAAIEWQAQVFQKRTGIKYIFKAHPENITLDKDRSTDIFRIFQETLTNVTRHANASEIQIELNHTNGHVVLEIKDNGRGISDSEAQDANSLGLTGMRERAHLWRGEIQITGQPGNGTTVQLAIPCTKP
ncbi:MAG: PAS domain S-box protein, partial [Nitrospinales bacterium]